MDLSSKLFMVNTYKFSKRNTIIVTIGVFSTKDLARAFVLDIINRSSNEYEERSSGWIKLGGELGGIEIQEFVLDRDNLTDFEIMEFGL